jgi:hypothetical protein
MLPPISPPCLAYIDAGTGSLLLQFLIGGLLGALFLVKAFWRSLVGFVGRLFGRKADKVPETTDAEKGTAE